MKTTLVIYFGDTVKEIDLSDRTSLSVGDKYECELRLPDGLLNGCEVMLSRGTSGWAAKCSGNVQKNGVLVQETELKSGDVLVLSREHKIGLEFVQSDDGDGTVIPLAEFSSLKIGRSENSHIRINDKRVGRAHAELINEYGKWNVRDLESRNGTYVNGRRITQARLTDADELVICGHSFVFNNETLICDADVSILSLNLPRVKANGPKTYPFFQRSPRLERQKKEKETEIQPAPAIGGKPEINWLTVLLPSVSMTIIYAVYATISKSTSFLIMLPMMLIGVVVSIVNYNSQKKKYTSIQGVRREKYEEYLNGVISDIESYVNELRESLLKDFPSPKECDFMVRRLDRRLWERKPADADFMTLRLGTGTVKSDIEIKVSNKGIVLEEDEYTNKPQEIKDKYRVIEGVPVSVDLKNRMTCGVTGDRNPCVDLVRSLIIEASTYYCYDELKLITLYPERERAKWEWVRWLPHSFDDTRSERYTACTKYGAEQVFKSLESVFQERSANAQSRIGSQTDIRIPFYLFIVADMDLLPQGQALSALSSNDPSLSMAVILLSAELSDLPRSTQTIVAMSNKGSGLIYNKESSDDKQAFVLDGFAGEQYDSFARAMAPIRIPEKNAEYLLPSCVTFLEGYGVQNPNELDIGERWRDSRNYKSMAVPIGVKANGESFYFDIHEKKHGPHGLVAGMTGSGKSEMVQSWMLAMALQFSPADAAFVIIDFKGTGLILPFTKLPHLAGSISNLDTNIQRNLFALESEMQRRQALFDTAGVNSIEKYLKLCNEGKPLERIPYLFVVIDEYAEFKNKFPEFTASVNSLFRTGRSLGIYVVLLTQNPTGIVSGQSEDNVKFRWCLKVANAAASKEMLGKSDAAKIVNPGRAYIKIGEDEVYELVQSYWSGAPYNPLRRQRITSAPHISVVNLQGERTEYASQKSGTIGATQKTEIEAVIDEIVAFAGIGSFQHSRQIWQPKLPPMISLPDIIPERVSDEYALAPVVGLVDNPRQQSQYPFAIELSEDGHVAIIGAPGTGKTTLIQTMIVSLSTMYSPNLANIYIMDFGGWNLQAFKDFPHVGSVANGNDSDRIQATARFIKQTFDKRREDFAQAGVGSIEAYRDATGETMPYILLVVDNIAPVYELYPNLEELFQEITREGGNYGLIMIITSNSTMALGFKLKQNIKTLIALQMTDKADYTDIVGKTDGLVPDDTPGRGLCREERVLEFQAALPTAEKRDSERSALLAQTKETLAQKWAGQTAVRIKTIPDKVRKSDVTADRFGIGLSVDDIQPVAVCLDDNHHTLIVSCDELKQRRNFVRVIIDSIGSENCDVYLRCENAFDYSDLKDGVSVIGEAEQFDTCVEELTAELNRRKKLRDENKDERFKEIFVVIENWKECFDEAAEETVARMKSIARHAAGLGVYLIICADAEDIIRMYHQGEAVCVTAVKKDAVALGGSLRSHSVFETNLSASAAAEKLAGDEGCYIHDGRAVRFKTILYREGD